MQDGNSVVKLKGIIVERRSFGRGLAFADILVKDEQNHDVVNDDDDDGISSERDDTQNKKTTNKMIVSVAFRRNTFLHENFPTKKSTLAYGALVELEVQKKVTDVNKSLTEVEKLKKGPEWEVLSWKILEADENMDGSGIGGILPRDQAELLATIDTEHGGGDGGISCSKYLQVRAETFLKLSNHSQRLLQPKKKKPQQQHPTKSDATQLLHDSESMTHKSNDRKSLRARIFADWLLHEFGITQSDNVLDVAGGKGQLSMQLSLLGGIACTVIDPLVRKRPKMKHVKKHMTPIPHFEAHVFRKHDPKTIDMVHNCSILVGLHPDEPTEAIVDMALEYNKSFAVVPCCVFPTLFPFRALSTTGETVHTYTQFLSYLMEKDIRIQQASLPLEGKNQVIYFHGARA